MEGDSTTFFCDSLNAVEWYDEEDLKISNQNPLIINFVDPLRQGYYQCKSRDDYGNIFWGKGIFNVISKNCVYLLNEV